ncbi:MAG: hypothetical protein DRG20_05950 [Deltaproteobacteria bacterium]|nr:YIP1 family protein [Deltaproteobacteria bacterium]RLA88555.1 MAG: hypothetical protein DRG20_05950 [Deltaproteobacteria bacterium]
MKNDPSDKKSKSKPLICPYCGAKLVPGLTFCPRCHQKITKETLFKREEEPRYKREERIEEGVEEKFKEKKEPKQERVFVSEQEGTPWDERDSVGFLQGIIETIKEVLFSPSELFSKVILDGSIKDALIFALIVGSAGWIIGFMWQAIFQNFSALIFMKRFGPIGHGMAYSTGIGIIYMFIAPIFVLIGLFIGSAILHVCLMIVGGNRSGFEGTFKVVAYSTATQILAIVPICGGIVAGIWAIVAEIIGLSRVHDISTGKAALAVFLPIIVCCGLIAGMGVLMPFFFGGPHYRP